MAYWLFKQEPSCYSYDNLEKDGETVWDGVNNALAQKHLRSIKAGDKVFFYHSGSDKAIVAIMEVPVDPIPDPENEKRVNVQVKPLKRLKHPVSLARIKADESFAEWELVRMSRLSVMPVTAAIWKKIEAMSKQAEEE